MMNKIYEERIALCVSGQPRCYAAAFEYVRKNILNVNKNQIDVFYHTWEGPDRELLFNVQRLYQPKNHLVEPRLNSDSANKYDRIANPLHPAWNTLSMIYSVYKANQLKVQWELKKGFKYAYVVRSRFDFAINVPININDSIPYNVVYLPGGDRLNDQFAFARSEAMDLYCNTFANVDYLYDQKQTLFNGEQLLEANAALYDLNIQHFNAKHPFPPGKYNGTWHSLFREDFNEWNTLRG